MKGILRMTCYPGTPDVTVDVPTLQLEQLPELEPGREYVLESLVPEEFRIGCACPNCPKVHTAVYKRVGFRYHDDGDIPVYDFIGILP